MSAKHKSVFVATLVILLGLSVWIWFTLSTSSPTDRWEPLREQARSQIEHAPGYKGAVKAYIQSHFDSASEAAEREIPVMPEGYDLGLAAYMLYLETALFDRAQADDREDVMVFLASLRKPP